MSGFKVSIMQKVVNVLLDTEIPGVQSIEMSLGQRIKNVWFQFLDLLFCVGKHYREQKKEYLLSERCKRAHPVKSNPSTALQINPGIRSEILPEMPRELSLKVNPISLPISLKEDKASTSPVKVDSPKITVGQEEGEEVEKKGCFKRLGTALKVVFAGALVLGGGCLLYASLAQSSPVDSYALANRAVDQTFSMQSNLSHSILDLQESCLRYPSYIQHSYTEPDPACSELFILENQLKENALLSTKMQKMMRGIEKYIPKFSFSNIRKNLPDPAVLKASLSITPSRDHLFDILGSVVGGQINTIQSGSKVANSDAVRYVQSNLGSLAKNSAQHDAVLGLQAGLEAYEPFEKHLTSLQDEVNQAIVGAMETLEEIRTKKSRTKKSNENLNDASNQAESNEHPLTQEDVDQIFNSIEKVRDEAIAGTGKMLSKLLKESRFLHGQNTKGFFVPSSDRQQLLHFIPETNLKEWTLRIYGDVVFDDGISGYQPYREQKHLHESQLLAKQFLSTLSFATPQIPSKLNDVDPIRMGGLFTREDLVCSLPTKEGIIKPFDHYSSKGVHLQRALNDVMFLELGDEVLDFYISSMKKYIDHHSNEIKSDQEVYKMLSYAADMIAHRLSNAESKSLSIDIDKKSYAVQQLVQDLKRIGVNLKGSLMDQAPVVETEMGLRRIAVTGEVPTDSRRMLASVSGKYQVQTSLNSILEPIMGVYSSKELVSSLTQAADNVEKSWRDHPKEVLVSLENWMQYTNPKVIGESVLRSLSDLERRQVLSTLNRISQVLFSLQERSGAVFASPESMVSMLEILALTDRVMAYSPGFMRKGEGISMNGFIKLFSVPLESFSEIIEGGDLFFRCFDPQIDERILSIREWGHQRKEILDRDEYDYKPDLERHNIPSENRPRFFPVFSESTGFFDPDPQSSDFNWIGLSSLSASSKLDISERKYEDIRRKSRSLFGYSDRNYHDDRYDSRSIFGYTISAPIETDFAALSFGDPYMFKLDDKPFRHMVAEPCSAVLNRFAEPCSESPFGMIRCMVDRAFHMKRSAFPALSESAAQDPAALEPKYTKEYGVGGNYFIRKNLPGLNREVIVQAGLPDGVDFGHGWRHLEPRMTGNNPSRQLREKFSSPRKNEKDEIIYRSGIQELDRSLFDENLAVAESVTPAGGNSMHDSHIIQTLRAEPSLQIQRTLGYAEGNPGWLRTHDGQIDFLNLLFDPTLLIHQLHNPMTGPKIELRLAKFFKTQHDLALKKEDRLFFNLAAIRLHQHSQLVRAKGVLKSSVPEELQFLCDQPTKMMDDSAVKGSLRSSYAALKALALLNEKSVDVSGLLNALLLYRTNSPLPMMNEIHILRQLDRMLIQFRPQIEAYLKNNSDGLKKILQGIVDPVKAKLVVSEKNPLVFSNEEGTIVLDLRKGELIEKGQKGIALPSEVVNSRSYQQAHGTTQYRGEVLDLFTYRFVDKKNVINYVQKDPSVGIWAAYKQFSDSQEVFRLVSDDWLKLKEDWLPSKWMKSQFTHWYRGGDDPEVRLLNRQGDPVYHIKLKEQLIEGIYDQEEGLQLGEATGSYSWAEQFEEKEFTHIWINKATKVAKKIEFPRLGLTLTWKSMDASGGGWCDGGWCLAPRQIHPMFPGEKNFLWFKNSEGGERVVMPRQMIKQDEGISTSLPFDRREGESITQGLLYFERDLRTGKYTGQTDEAKLYAAMIHFRNRNFLESHQILRGFESHAKVFSSNEMKIIDRIISDGNDIPQAIAVRRLAAEIKQNDDKKKIPEANKDLRYQVSERLKERYEKVFKGLPGLQLPPNVKQVDRRKFPGESQVFYQPTIKTIDTKQWFAKTADISGNSIEIFNRADSWIQRLPQNEQKVLMEAESLAQAHFSSKDNSVYQIANAQALQSLSEKAIELEVVVKDLEESIDQMRLNISFIANPLPKDPQKARDFMLQLHAGLASFVDFDDLKKSFEGANLLDYQRLNSEIDLDAAKALDREFQRYIDAYPYLKHQKNLLNAIRQVVNASEVNRSDAVKAFLGLVESGRQYEKSGPRIREVLEATEGWYLREKQMRALEHIGVYGSDKFVNGNGARILPMEPGGGKTSVLLPTVTKANAYSGKFTMIVMPELQIPTAGKAYSQVMKDVYGDSTTVIQFTNRQLSVEYLTSVLRQLEDARDKGYPILVSAKSLRSFTNLFIKNYQQYLQGVAKNNSPDKQKAIVELLQSVDGILRTTPIIDELGDVFNWQVDTTYPSGEMRVLNRSEGVSTLMLYDLLESDDIQKIMHFNYFPQGRMHGAKPFTQEGFNEEVVPLLVKKSIAGIQSGSFGPELEFLKDFFSSRSDKEKENIESYLLKTNSPAITQWIGGVKPEIRSVLALLRGQFHVLLPLTLDHKIGVRYGFASPDHLQISPFAVEGEPNNSTFSSMHTLLNYNRQAMRHSGIPQPLVKQFVSDLQARHVKELSDQVKEGSSIKSAKRAMTSVEEALQKFFVDKKIAIDDEDLQAKITQILSSQSLLFNQLMERYVLPLHKRHERSIKATSQTLGNLFAADGRESEWIGMTATPDDYRTYPGIHNEPADVTSGEMLAFVAERGEVVVLNENPKDLFSSSACQGVDRVIDGVGYLANQNRQKLVDDWGVSCGKATVTVDRELGPVIKKHPNDVPVLVSESNMSPDQWVALYAQADIVGTDIKSPKNALDLVIVGKEMTWEKFKQAVGRNRDRKNSKKIRLGVSSIDASIMKKRLGLSPKENLTVRQILGYLEIHSAEAQKRPVEVILRAKPLAVIKNYVQNRLREKGSLEKFDSNVQQCGELINDLFVPVLQTDPWVTFGGDDVLMSKEQVFQMEIDSLIGEGTALNKKLVSVFGPDVILELREQIGKVVARDISFINDMIPKRSMDNLEQESEVEEEAEVEEETEEEQEVQNEQEQQKEVGSAVPSYIKPYLQWPGLSTTTIAQSSWWKDLKKTSLNEWMLEDKNPKMASLFNPGLGSSVNIDMGRGNTGKPAQFAVIVKSDRNPVTNYRILMVDVWEAVRIQQALLARRGIELPESPSETGIDPTGLADWLSNHDWMPGLTGYGSYRYGMDKDPLLGFRPVFDRFRQGWQVEGSATSEGDSNVLLVDLEGAFIAGTDDSLSLMDPELRKMWLQTQIFAGKIDFNADEAVIIKGWIKEWLDATGSKKESLRDLESVFKKFLVNKEDLLARFAESSLGGILRSFV